MNGIKKLVLGGITLLGVAAAGYRAYELHKLKKAYEQEQQVIDIQVETQAEK